MGIRRFCSIARVEPVSVYSNNIIFLRFAVELITLDFHMDLESLRREYLQGGLSRADLAEDPIDQFSAWMQQAIDLELADPTAMTIATVSADGQPSQRIVLLKHFDKTGFVFYTNYGSRKSNELTANPKISLHFPWHTAERQVKICGEATKISTAESIKYFISRPKESQLAALASAAEQRSDFAHFFDESIRVA